MPAGNPDGSVGADMTPAMYPAFKPTMPQLVNASGSTGGIIASPTFVNVYWMGETDQTTLDKITSDYVKSSYYSDGVKEYGVTGGSAGASIATGEAVPATWTSDDLKTWLTGRLDGTHSEWGAVDAATLASKVFVLLPPASTQFTLMQGGSSLPLCTQFSGYHDGFTLPSGAQVNFALVGRCDTALNIAPTITYGIVAAATDVVVSGMAKGWGGFDQGHREFGFVTGSEVSSACAFAEGTATPSDLSFAIARTWSNAQAAAYHDPCIPTPDSSPWFIAAPGMQQFDVAVGSSVTIDLSLLSDGPTAGPWTVHGVDVAGGTALTLTATPMSGSNGDTMQLKVDNTSLTMPHIVGIVSKLGTRRTAWFVTINGK